MIVSPIFQVVIILMVVSAGITAIFGSRRWLCVSLAIAVLLGLLIGVLQDGLPQGLRHGIIYSGVLVFIAGVCGGITRLLQRSLLSKFQG